MIKEKRGDNHSSNNSIQKCNITIHFEGSEILERTASKFGTGAHIIIPKEYTDKKVKIIFEGDQ